MTPIPGPILLLGLPLAAAIIAHMLRRWALAAAVVSAATAAGLALLCLHLPLDRSAFVLGQEIAFGRPVVIAGRVLALDPAGQLWLAFVFALAAVLYLLAWRLEQGQMFFSFSQAILVLYALIALLQTFSLAILVFAMSATPAAFMILGRRPQTASLRAPGLRRSGTAPRTILRSWTVRSGVHEGGSVRGGQRYLVVTLLAVPFLLAAAWLISPGQAPLAADAVQMARQAVLPAALGFGLLLAVFPFGTWMPALAADAPPIVTAFICTAGQAMAILLALTFLRDAPWPLDNHAALEVIQVAGLVTAAIAGVMAAVQRDFGRVFGYAALSDTGCLLLALGLGGSQGLTLALLHMVNRSASITLTAAALATVRQRANTDRFDELHGWARRLPIATAALVVGGLALAGFPVTAGFPTHWAIGRAATARLGLWALLLLASSAAIAIGLLRGLSAMLGAERPGGEAAQSGSQRLPAQALQPGSGVLQSQTGNPRSGGPGQPVIASLMLLALGALVIALGLYPQLFLTTVRSAVAALALWP